MFTFHALSIAALVLAVAGAFGSVIYRIATGDVRDREADITGRLHIHRAVQRGRHNHHLAAGRSHPTTAGETQ